MFTLEIDFSPVLCRIHVILEIAFCLFLLLSHGMQHFLCPSPTLLLFQSPALPINILMLKSLCTPLRNTQLVARVFWLQETPKPQSHPGAQRHSCCFKAQGVETSSALLGKLLAPS